MLGKALLKVKSLGLETECREILNSALQVNLITEWLVARLELPARATSTSINGIGKNWTKVQHQVNVIIQSRLNDFSARSEAFVWSQIIAPQPAQLLHIDKLSICSNVTLSDPTFIRYSIRAEYYHKWVSIGQIKLAATLPVQLNINLGKVSVSIISCNMQSLDWRW